MFIYLNKRAQSTAEYVIVLGLIVGAVIAMQTYVKRGFQGRVREAVDFTDQGGQTSDTDNAAVVQFSGDQYEPYYLRSTFNSTRDADSQEQLLQSGAVDKTLTQEHSTRTGNQTITGTRNGVELND